MKTARTLSPLDSFHRIHTYYKGTPYHPDGRRVLCFRFTSLEHRGQLCLLDRESGDETVLAEAEVESYHTGANAYFCDSGHQIIYREREGIIGLFDLETGAVRRLEGTHCHYSGYLERHFIEVDADYSLDRQGEMGIYLRELTGERRRLVTVDELLAAHPLGKSIRQARILFRLGAEISPDQKRVRLGLLTRVGGLLKDFYTCRLDGDFKLEFHGKLGSHPGWHANSRDILTLVNPWQTILGDLADYFEIGEPPGGMLGSYNTQSRKLRILSDYKIRSGSHVAPSPDGKHVVMDTIDDQGMHLLLYSEDKGMQEICQEAWHPPDLQHRQYLIRQGDPQEKRYDVSAHPVFSRDGTTIIYNSCAEGTIRLNEIRTPS